MARRIGLIGGLALRAGLFYYEQIAQRFAARGETLDLVLRHADVGRVLALVGAGDRDGLGQYLGGVANELFDGGVGLVAVTAVAPHLAFAEMSRLARGELVDGLAPIAAGVAARGWQRVAFFGNRAVMTSNIFGAIPDAMAVPLAPDAIERVHVTYGDIALCGKRGSAAETDILCRAAHDAMRSGAEAIVLAGTDLSSFYADAPPAFPYLDVAQLHIDSIVARATG